jgi:hypothetical protein
MPKRCKYICNALLEYIEKVVVDNVVQIYMDDSANVVDVPRFQANPSRKFICTL